jgi:hypothetical protein
LGEIRFGKENYSGMGRPKGSRNKRTSEIIERLQARGDKDPLDFLSEIISSENHYSQELKTQAANYLAPYMHSKCGSTVPLRYIPEPVTVPYPNPKTIDQAADNIGYISQLKSQGIIDLDFADSLIRDNRAILDALVEEIKCLAAQGVSAQQTIVIQGGLPVLPGTNVIMPEQNGMNGHAIEGNAIEGPSPGELKAQGPHPLQKHHFQSEPELPSPDPKDGDP